MNLIQTSRFIFSSTVGTLIIAMILMAVSFSASGQVCPAECGGPFDPFDPLGLSSPVHVETSDLLTSTHQDVLAAYGALTDQPF